MKKGLKTLVKIHPLYIVILLVLGFLYWDQMSYKATITLDQSDHLIEFVDVPISVTIPDGGWGASLSSADCWCYQSVNEELEIVIDFKNGNALMVNRFSYGLLDPNDILQIKYGPIVIINEEIAEPIRKVEEVAPWLNEMLSHLRN